MENYNLGVYMIIDKVVPNSLLLYFRIINVLTFYFYVHENVY